MGWKYTKRQDAKIAVTLDSNVWNFLFDRNIDLALELPAELFAIYIPREVEMENIALDGKISKQALKFYIERTIATCSIQTTSIFGFASEGPGPQRYGSFNQGTFISDTEREFREAIGPRYLFSKPQRGSQLSHNEADAAVAVQSFFSIVITCERPNKSGPISFAAQNGGKVLYLSDFDENGLSLADAITVTHLKA